MTAYSQTNGINAFLARQMWLKMPVVREPLDGLMDGVNVIFNLKSPPALDSTVTVIDSAGNTVTPASVDEASGSVVLSTAPTSTLYASYTHCGLTSDQLTGLFVAGFEEMESRWQRGYYLTESSSIPYVSSNSVTVVDPEIGSSTFSVRPAQTNFLVGCMTYVFSLSSWQEAAATAIATREKWSAGMMIDSTRRPEAFAKLVEAQERALKALMDKAITDAGTTNIGVVGPRTDPYPNVYTTTFAVPEPCYTTTD